MTVSGYKKEHAKRALSHCLTVSIVSTSTPTIEETYKERFPSVSIVKQPILFAGVATSMIPFNLLPIPHWIIESTTWPIPNIISEYHFESTSTLTLETSKIACCRPFSFLQSRISKSTSASGSNHFGISICVSRSTFNVVAFFLDT